MMEKEQIKYINITHSNSLVLSKDKKYQSDELLKKIKEEICKSNIHINDFNQKNKIYLLSFEINGKIVSFNIYIKNITGAGWKNKPEIKRCQVNNMKTESASDIDLRGNCYNLILGYYNYDNNPILVAWDAYRYLNHNTVRSCYVTIDALIRGYEKKFNECVVSSQKCWIFTGENFDIFINKYITYINEFYKKGKNNV